MSKRDSDSYDHAKADELQKQVSPRKELLINFFNQNVDTFRSKDYFGTSLKLFSFAENHFIESKLPITTLLLYIDLFILKKIMRKEYCV